MRLDFPRSAYSPAAIIAAKGMEDADRLVVVSGPLQLQSWDTVLGVEGGKPTKASPGPPTRSRERRACWVGLPHSHPPHLSASHQFVSELPLPEVCKIIINVSLSCS